MQNSNDTGAIGVEYFEIHDFPGKSKSSVWKDFGFYKTGTGELDKSCAVCKICLAQVKYCGNTTNLHTHLAKHRPKPPRDNRTYTVYDEVIITNVEHDGTQHKEQSFTMPVTLTTPTVTEKRTRPMHFPAVQTLLMNSNRVQDLNTALVKYLISELRPIDTVENSAFVDLLKTADPGYEVPKSRYFATSLIPQLCDETKSKMAIIVQNAESVTVSIEVWSSLAGEDFVSANVHLIDDAWENHTYNLCTEQLTETIDMGAHLSNFFRRTYENWQIRAEPVILSSVDSNIETACESLGWTNLMCLGNTIDIAASAALASEGHIKETVNQSRSLVKAINNSQEYRMQFQRAQQSLSCPEKPLLMDKSGDWISTFDMLQSVVDNCEAIQKVNGLSSCANVQSVFFSCKNIKETRALLEILLPLKTAANIVADKASTTASMILPILRKLEISLTCKTENLSRFLTQLKGSIWEKLSKPYEKENVRCCLLISSLLDPRYKDLLFVDKADRQKGKDTLADEATVLYRNSKANFDISRPFSLRDDAQRTDDLFTDDHEPCAKISKLSSEHDDWLADVVCINTPGKSKASVEEAVLAEIDRYLSAEQTTTQPLGWWKNRQSIYPTICRLAKKYLGIQATTEQHSRACSSDVKDRIWTQQRSLVSPDWVDDMIFLNKNFFKLQ